MKTSALLAGAAFALAACLANGAGAATLTLLNEPTTTVDQPYTLDFTATTSATTISFSGYQAPGEEDAFDISAFLKGGSSNLLGGAWAFTQAPGSDSYTYSDGTSVPAIAILGLTPGSSDSFSQTIKTVPGQSYTVSFDFTNNNYGATGKYVLTELQVSETPAAVPEPATWAMLLLGVAGLGAAMRISRRRNESALAAA